MKREFQDITDVLINWDIPDWITLPVVVPMCQAITFNKRLLSDMLIADFEADGTAVFVPTTSRKRWFGEITISWPLRLMCAFMLKNSERKA